MYLAENNIKIFSFSYDIILLMCSFNQSKYQWKIKVNILHLFRYYLNNNYISADQQNEDENLELETADLQEENVINNELQNVSEIHQVAVEEVEPRKKRQRFEEDADTLGQQCPICLEAWESTGEHRLCCLKCGHLFGLSCLKRWLGSQSVKTCPTCKKKVGRNDLRCLYAAKLLAVDNSELYKLQNELDELRKSKTKLQNEYSKCLYEISTLKEQNKNLKQQLILLEDKCVLDLKHSGSYEQSVNVYKDKSITINTYGGCRVMDYNNHINLVVVSAKSVNPLFCGYGLKSIDVASYKPIGFVSLHSQPIRDVKFHQQNPWILTASMDKSFKIVDCGSNSTINTFNSNMPLWSCAWHHQQSHIMYIGDLTNVAEFDMRQLSEPVQHLKIATDMSPVISISSIDKPDTNVNCGVLVCKLNSMWYFEYSSGLYNINDLPIEGSFASMSYEKHNKQILASLRPTSRNPFTRHVLGQLCRRQDIMSFDAIHSMNGLSTTQKILSRTCFANHNNVNYFAAYEESLNNVSLWNAQTGQKNSSIVAREPVLDMCNFKTHSGNYLITLTEKKIDFLKFP